jgi:multidrug resistance efflux pump
LQRQYQEAAAKGDRAAVNIILAQLDQAKAQEQLLHNKINHTQISSPFSGQVIYGDLSQRLGGSVDKGEVLFEVSPLDQYRVILQVKESRISDVSVGQSGILRLSAMPEHSFGFVVNKLTPLTSSYSGSSYFQVEALLDEHVELWQPGMEGVGNIIVDQRPLHQIWSRDLVEWWRLQLWSWWG